MGDQQRLRDAATKLRGYSGDLTSEIDTLIRKYPESDNIWTGPAADTFYGTRDDVRRRLETLAGDLDDHADALDDKADSTGEEPEGE
ncbi:uncharacterized protein YukE [Haloactinopolyspora alba]|uniref:Uncharacterized protein YukE n=1 Tax=Haloactinopolyspora alba TaxID=648780 RepID=A0A2P8DZX6_9ACTN|nr:WXG100 family type VII secretion target [Haloactinopolyspora alba]PSL02783.1 uncharacterized protein YukE [Haloactinopolyspora alba]